MATMNAAPASLTPLALAARLLHIPPGWLRAEAEAGRLPHLRAGTAYLFDVDLVERLLLVRARAHPDAGKEAAHG